MGRNGPKVIVLIAIAALIVAIYVVERRALAPPSTGIVYVNPNAGAITPTPAPAPPVAAP